MRLLLIIIILAVLLFFFFRYLEYKSLYFPFPDIDATPSDIGLEYEDVVVDTEDGLQISGWYIPSSSGNATILLCHGNGGNISHRLDKIRMLNQIGLNILIFDYRGYGKSKGKPSEEGLYLDAIAMFDYLVNDRKINPSTIILFGESIGGAVAIDLATKRETGGIIIEASFSSLGDMAKLVVPFIPSFMYKGRFDSINKIENITQPKLFFHSPEDEIVPLAQGRKLFDAAPDPKIFILLQGGHNDGFYVSSEIFMKEIDRFVNNLSGYITP